MKRLMVLLAAFGVILALCQDAPAYETFYRDYDERVRTKEQYLAKLEKTGEMRATWDEILFSAGRAFNKVFRTPDEYKKFILSPDVTLEPCTFENAAVDHLEVRPRRIGTSSRGYKPGELCLFYQGGDRISLDCGQGIADARRKVLLPPSPKPAAEERKREILNPWQGYRPTVVADKKCIAVVESNPSPPISVGVLGGAGYRWAGAVAGSVMSIGSSHRQETCN